MTTTAARDEWTLHAACAGHNQAPFFSDGALQTVALAICRPCPVRAECLYDALTHETPSTRHGIWGGLTSRDRQALRRPSHPREVVLRRLRTYLARHDADRQPPVERTDPPMTAAAPTTPPPAAEALAAQAATEDAQPTSRARPNGGRYTPEQRAVFERRTVELLRAGASYSEITAELGITSPTIVRIRRQAGLPASGRTGAPPSRSKAEALALHIEQYGDGHARWTGPMAGRMAQLHAEHGRFNARRVVFEEHHGRPPVGRVRSNCGEQACIAGAHLIDNILRDAQHPAVACHSAPLFEGTSLAVTTTSSAPPLPTKDLLQWAEEHSDSSVQALAARVREGLADLRLRYEAAHELTAIARKKEELEAQLTALAAREAALAPPKKKRKPSSYTRDYVPATVRAWAAETGIDCPGRGQIPKAVLDAWRAAHQQAGTPS
ncbi:WhiB family transcriptional regulator [Streptomyces olivaceus]|uniref:WhiB family transcriptional regulator n=1 Tax=Streptomyces olivaceus TaxID=47716 RepID=UPI001CCAC0E5|nr:WhiB family transcriptional regulator [Streptomyces olivaceus]MBZ6258819.1 WhiB family transcriptional regulator [Streptomyces olivaceus]